MSTMYRLKAYFGMVPAEELGDYDDEADADRYGSGRRTTGEYADARWGGDRFADEGTSPRQAEEWDAAPARAGRAGVGDRTREPVRTASRTVGATATATSTRGALAIDSEPEPGPGPARPMPVSASVPEPRVGGSTAATPPVRITTLQPSSYNEARTIGERYRDGQPVIMNLTELDDAAAKRLVDFAAGLAFALRGSIDKVTNRVFLLTPADVEVSAADARKLAERSVGSARGAAGGPRVDSGRSFAATRVEDRSIFRQD